MIIEKKLEKIYKLRDRFMQQLYKRQLYDYQTQPSNKIIEMALTGQGKEIYIEFSRQSGKTTGVTDTINFLLIFINDFIKELKIPWAGQNWTAIIGAPQKDQAKTDFDRIKDGLELAAPIFNISFEESNGTTLKLSNGCTVHCFPISPTSHIESKTGHLLVFEEAQDILDAEADKKMTPMGASTNAPKIYIGTAGYKICQFYKGVNSGDQNAFVYPAPMIIAERRKRYEEDGNEWHLNYEKFINNEIMKKGEMNPEVQTQYFLKWQLEQGMWMTEERFKQCLVDEAPVRECKDHPVLIGMDVAKESDVTFLTALRKIGQKKITRTIYEDGAKEIQVIAPVYQVLNWFMIRGVLYQDQWEAVDEWLERWNVSKMNIDSTGSGDSTADYYVKRYNGWDYDMLKYYETNKMRGTARPIKFTPQSKHTMYNNLDIAIKEGRLFIPAKLDGMTEQEIKCFNRFKAETLSALREWKGSLLNVRHPDKSKGEQGDIETDDSLDSIALPFYDIDLEPFDISIA